MAQQGHNIDIANQLKQFGFNSQEIINAMNKVTNKNDINEITDYLSSNINRTRLNQDDNVCMD